MNFAGALTVASLLLKPGNAACMIVEVGPHPVLTPLATECLSALGVAVLAAVASMRRDHGAEFFEGQVSRLRNAMRAETSTESQSVPSVSSVVIPSEEAVASASGSAVGLPPLEVSARIRALLADHFGVRPNSSDTPLMEAGLDSVDLPELASHLNAEFDVKLPPTHVLEAGTIRAITSHMVHAQALSRPLSPPLPPIHHIRLVAFLTLAAVPSGVSIRWL